MKILVAFLLALFAAFGVSAQTVPAQLSWTNPTTSVDGVPLTGANALTGIEVHWSTSPIADTDLSRAPQVTLGTVQTTTQTIAVTNGSTLYFRVRAINAGGKSAFSNQATKVVSLSTTPGAPSGLTITFVVSQDESGAASFAMVVEPLEDRGPGEA